MRLWLWKNFVDGKPEYWAFDNPFPVYMDNDDPQTLGEPCGYAVLKPSRKGRYDISEDAVLLAIERANQHEPSERVKKLRLALNNLLNDCINFDGGKLTDCILKEASDALKDTID